MDESTAVTPQESPERPPYEAPQAVTLGSVVARTQGEAGPSQEAFLEQFGNVSPG